MTRELCDGARVIVANPVQYQASLGSILNLSKIASNRKPVVKRRVTDEAWKALWKSEALRRDFEGRLCECAPRVIINACTGTVSKHVAVFVAAHYLNSKLYDTTHPSSWIHRKNRWLKQLPL